MKDTLRLARALACGALILFIWGCDDNTGSNPNADTGMGGSGGTGGMDDMGMGGMGGTPTTRCVRDLQCPADQYCAVPEGARDGLCQDGCRTGDDACPDGQFCDPTTHMCTDEPCTDDDACAAGEYCDDGTCTAGCREGDPCGEPDADGRESICNTETRACEALYPCCNADACTAELPDVCAAGGGEVIEGVGTCDQNPCGAECEEDIDCPLGQYCNTEDGRCADGCRLDDPSTCLPSEICDADKHTCEPLRCMGDGDCPDDRYCDPDSDLCVLGCRIDPDNCPDGQQCIDRACVVRCNPRAPVGDPAGCLAGEYCDPFTFNCLEDCFEHGDCDVDRYCDPDNNRCIPGCRDDEGELGEPNNDFGTATPIDLVPGGNGRIGVADGRIICGNDPDFYVVELEAGERMRIDLEYVRDAGNLDLRLHGDEVGDDPIEAATLNVPERIEFPALGEAIPRPATYYIEVYPPGNDVLRRLEYRVSVSVVDAAVACFPDNAEPGDNDRPGATVVGPRGGTYIRNICPADVDLFRLDLNPNDALRIQLNPEPLDANVQALLYPSTINPAQARIRLDRANNWLFEAELGAGTFLGSDEWYLRVSGVTPDVVAEYEVQIVRESADVCDTDSNTERNDTIAEAVRLDAFPLDAPHEVPLDTAICTVGDPDVDVFCFAAEMGETIEAWAESPAGAVNGRLALRFSDARGVYSGREGRGVEDGQMSDPARVVNVVAGDWCVHVSGLDRAQGPYQLYVQRLSPAMGVCANDVGEADGRNDRSTTATAMTDVSGDGRRYEYLEGYICDIGAESDVDWYSFNVAQAGSSLCVMVNDFDRTRADVDLDVFPSVGAVGGDACQRPDQCNQGRAACIERRCTPPYETSARSNVDFEMVNLRRPFFQNAQAGPFLLRVGHRDVNEGPYQVSVTVTPTEQCGADWQEIEGDNDEMARATLLGSGELGICDTWICGDERLLGDWYEIEVPAGEDRTVLINYSGGIEGRLTLNAVAPDQPGDPESGMVHSTLNAGNHQCINIRGGGDQLPVLLQVAANQFLDDERIDYSLRVVPTDLDANPEGECEALGASNFPACPPRDEWDIIFGRPYQPDDCWVTAELP